MADDELPKYEKGKVALGAGNLQQASDITITRTKTKDVKGTLAKESAGIFTGSGSAELTMKVMPTEDGVERDYDRAYENDEKVQFRLKLSGRTIVFTGEISDLTDTSSEGAPAELEVKAKGIAKKV